jgi:predicted Zn-dependent protease
VLWSNTYDRPEWGLTTIQSELAAEIARSMKVAAPVKARHVPKEEAHNYVMKARYEVQQLTSQSVTQAEADYQHAIDLDPEYAAAFLGVAIAKFDQAIARGSTGETDAERKGAEELVMKALALDPELPTAHAVLGVWAMQYDWDWQRVERELRLAIAGAPNATAEQYYAFFLIFRGRFREADEHLVRMQDVDPFSATARMNLATARYLEGRFAQDREVAQQVAAESPKMLAPQQLIAGSYIAEGHPQLALPILQELEARFPPIRLFEAMAYAKAGQREKALELMRPYEVKYPNPGVTLQWFALAYASMNDEPNTVKWLERSADLHEFQALNLAVNPTFASMRNSPKFRALEKRMGLVQ